MKEQPAGSVNHKTQIQQEYDRVSGQYERRWHRYMLRTVEETVRRAGLNDGDRILDVGCGTGALLRTAMT